MKKIIFSLLICTSTFIAQAQETIKTSNSDTPKNEVKLNFINAVVYGSVEIGYEYFIDDNQSVGFEAFINDVYNMSVGGKTKNYDTNSFQLTYNYYIGDKNGHANSGLVVFPLLKYRVGDYNKSETEVINMNSFTFGAGAGYKWNMNDNFVFGPYVTVGRNFSSEVADEFSAFEYNAGFTLGYRF